MKKILLLWFSLITATTFYAQTITIIDQETQKPLPGVVLMTESASASVVTNVKGKADLSIFTANDKIQIQSLGFKTQFTSLEELRMLSFSVELVAASLNLDQVVVSATRWRQSSPNVPSKIVTITPQDLALQNPQTAADLLGISGKVFIQKSQQGGGSPIIRGFSTNRLIYTLDGVRMNTAIFRGGNIQNVINIDPFAIESTEVLFGPGSVIYGSDAIGGVMSFQTLTPQYSLTDQPLVTGKASTRYSSANKERSGHIDVNVGWEKWSYVASFTSWDYDHLRQGSKGPDDYIKNVYPQRQDSSDVIITQSDPLLQIPSAYSQVNMMQKLRFMPNENWDFNYGFHYSTTSSYGRYDRHNRFRNGNLRYAEWDYGPQKWMMNNLNISHNKHNAVYDQVSLRLAKQSFEESRLDRLLNNHSRNTSIEKVDAYSVNLDLTKGISERNSLYYGLEYVLNKVTSDGEVIDIAIGVSQNGSSRYPQATWLSLAAYVNDEFRISKKLTFLAGLRYNQFMLDADFTKNTKFYPFPFTTAQINNNALTGSVGGVYRPAKTWVIKGSIGTAFRSPNVDDVGKVFDSEPGAVTVPNPDLKAEYAYNFDLSVAKVFGEVVKIDLAAYYIILQNAMVRRDFELNGEDMIFYDGQVSQVQAIQNAAVAQVFGLQAGIEIKLPAGFRLLSDINYQAGEEELDDGTRSPSRHAAPLFGVSRFRYKHNDLTLEVNAQYQGERSFENLAAEEQGKDEIYAKDENGNNYAPAWYTLNFRAVMQVSDTFRVSGGLENMTDQRYRTYSSGISGAGRNFVLAVRADF